jgi:hypothetical protein
MRLSRRLRQTFVKKYFTCRESPSTILKKTLGAAMEKNLPIPARQSAFPNFGEFSLNSRASAAMALISSVFLQGVWADPREPNILPPVVVQVRPFDGKPSPPPRANPPIITMNGI